MKKSKKTNNKINDPRSSAISSSAQDNDKDTGEKQECECEFTDVGGYFCSEDHEREYFRNHPELTGYLR